MAIQFQFRRDTRAVIATKTPAIAEFGYQTDVKQLVIGDGVTLGGLEIERKNYLEPLVVAALAADQNDWAPAGFKYAGLLRVSATAARNLTGIAGGTDGRRLFLFNTGTFAITLKDASASSVAANRFSFGADVTLGAGQAVQLYYSSTDSAWRLMSSAASSNIASGVILGRATAGSGPQESLTATQVNAILGISIAATQYFGVPAGTTAQRPGTPVAGMIRYNTDAVPPTFEGYRNGAWKSLGGGPSAGTDSVIRLNANLIDEDITIPANNNGFSGGPMTVNTGRTVTVSAGAVWTII